jgi:hypothetical protein
MAVMGSNRFSWEAATVITPVIVPGLAANRINGVRDIDDTVSPADSVIKYPPRKLQSETYTGPITLSNYQKFKWVREQLEKKGVNLSLPTGN